MKIRDGSYNISFPDIGNYYGSLCIKEYDGGFYWSIENYDGHEWEPISENLYNALLIHYNEVSQ